MTTLSTEQVAPSATTLDILTSTFNAKFPEMVHRHMCTLYRESHPDDTPNQNELRVLFFLQLFQLGCRHEGVVAGSAALFMKRLLDAEWVEDCPKWLPNDIDVWLDHPEKGWDMIGQLIQMFPECKSTYMTAVNGEMVTSDWNKRGPYPMMQNGDWQMICSVTVHTLTLQTICQRIETSSPERIQGNENYEDVLQIVESLQEQIPCDCQSVAQQNVACELCLRQTNHEHNPDYGYYLKWVSGYPETTFDMDMVAVAAWQSYPDEPLIEFRSRCEYTRRDTMVVRPQAMWQLGPVKGHPVPRDNCVESLKKRIAKYKARGWTGVYVPARTKIKFEGRFVVLDTPPEIMALAE